MSIAFEPAPIWRRVAAAIIDVFVVNIVVLSLISVVLNGNLAEAFGAVVFNGLYVVGTTAVLGGTPAKRLLGLWVFDVETEELVGWQAALVRWSVPSGIPLGFLLVAITADAPTGIIGTLVLFAITMPIIVFGSIFLREDRRGMHDLLAGTIVSHPVLDTRLD